MGAHFGFKLPLVLGGDITGTIEATGEAAENFKPGDAIYGRTAANLAGAYAEYAVAKIDGIAAKPASLDFENAASLPTAALTAWQALFDLADLRAGQKILITGTSGGVGSMAVQFAKAKGAFVVGTASERNAEFVKSLGADEFVDYTGQKFEEAVTGVNAVFDTVGGDTFEKAFQTVKKAAFW